MTDYAGMTREDLEAHAAAADDDLRVRRDWARRGVKRTAPITTPMNADDLAAAESAMGDAFVSRQHAVFMARAGEVSID